MMSPFAFNVIDGEEQDPALGPVALIVLTFFSTLKMINMERNLQFNKGSLPRFKTSVVKSCLSRLSGSRWR